MTWAEEELSRADLGDKRRNKRLIKIVSDLVEQPNESVTQASRECDSFLAKLGIVARIENKLNSRLDRSTENQ